MADQQHLKFTRVPQPVSGRRLVPRGGPRERRYGDVPKHAEDLSAQADSVAEAFTARVESATDFDPKLIMKFELNARVGEVDFERAGLAVLDSSSREVAVVFADDAQLLAFRRRLAEYQTGIREKEDGSEGSAPLEGFFDAIDGFRPLTPEDRMSGRLSEAVSEATGELHFDVEFWSVDSRSRVESWLEEARDAVTAAGGEWIDSLVIIRSGIAVARCRGGADVIERVASLDQVANVDTVPQPRISRAERAELQNVANLQIDDPEADAPVVGIVDSGVATGHPLLEPALVEAVSLHDEFGGQAEDGNGHGSMVAGVVLYGDVLESAAEGVFRPTLRIASVRVLDDAGDVPQEASFLRVLRDAIIHLVETWECRVINISIGDRESPFLGGKSTPTAAMLDTLARALDVVLVVSAGNMTLGDLSPHDETAARHPDHLLDEGNGLFDPAQAAIPLTVGAISEHDGVESRTLGTTVGTKCLAEAGDPAPFTRRGPGVENSVKPELVANGGNLAFDSGLNRIVQERGASIVSTSHRPSERLFDMGWGTSYAAPAVAHIAGLIVTEYPDLSANAIRALMLQSTRYANGESTFAHAAEKAELERITREVVGYGTLSANDAMYSQEGRVVMLAEDRIRPNDFHVYRVPITEAFADTSGPHEVSIALAFDPPVRHRRFDYLAHKLEFVLVRGLDIDSVYKLAGQDVGDPDAPSLSKFAYAGLRPTVTVRSRGANQMARVTSSRKPLDRHSSDWFVVVRSINRWLERESDPQPYALAVTLEVENTELLYAQVEARLEAELEALAQIS